MKFNLGDTIKVTAGKDKGKTGTIDRVFPAKSTVLVKGVNLYKRHLKKRDGFEGGVVTKERALPTANIAIVCPTCNKVTRVGYRIPAEGKKERFCKKCLSSLKQIQKSAKPSKK